MSPCLFNLYAEYIMRNAGLEEAQAGIKISGRNINNLRYADDIHSFPNFEPVRCSTANSNCCFLTCVQVHQKTGKMTSCAHLFKNFPQFVVIHTVKGFGIVSEAHVFLEFHCFFCDAADVGNLFSGSSAFSKSACTSGSSQLNH